MAKKKKGVKMTKHHCRPRSRGGHTSKVVLVEEKLHMLYSQLFQTSNHEFKVVEMLPEEIVDFLNETFWDNDYVIEMQKRR